MESDSGNSQNKTQNAQDFGKLQHGCEHYKRRCKIRAPSCDQIFSCRHCHNEATSSLSNPKERHEIVRRYLANWISTVAQVCSNCGVKMGEYFCDICKFYDDETEKKQFHCEECGFCRVGDHENFFHCQKCGSCYVVGLRNNHPCVENSMKCSCPVCYECLFDSVKGAIIMKCGHAMHSATVRWQINIRYRCPICSKTVFDVSNQWRLLDVEIKAVPKPEPYRYEVQILCNDCNRKSEAPFHILGHKCRECDSYNIRSISTPNCD